MKPFIVASDLTKNFGRTTVLSDVSLSLFPGEIVALLGANGAGKSTLVKILAGAHQSDGGTILVNGVEKRFLSTKDSRRAGICAVHQIINDSVVQDLTVTENLLLEDLSDNSTGVFLNRRRMRDRAEEIESVIGLRLALGATVRDLPQADRQLVAIARALASNPRLLILDEPTSSLSDKEAERLFLVLERLKASGVAIVYVSHRMSDIRRLADRAIVLRDGKLAGTFEAPLDLGAAVSAMLGRKVAAHEKRAPVVAGPAVVSFKDAQMRPGSIPFDLELCAGEVVVATGLLGAGKSELAQSLFGLRSLHSGRITLDGKPWAPVSPQHAIDGGVFMASEDRANNSLIPDFSVVRNMTLPFLSGFSSRAIGLVDRSRELYAANGKVADLSIKTSSAGALITTLSGGNQQKVVLSRWLLEPCRLLIFDEPFQGVDIAARRDIGARIRSTSKDRATLLICADVEEAFEVADRIIVLRNFAVVSSHAVGDVDPPSLMAIVASAHDAMLTDAVQPT
jgi:simple sugar transport system ATP-binding protein